ncbi:DUF4160 domain-containing protein [Desulfonatronum lacustre]|uniref:DUF4160 domain-containing protein n=1 Tax=Desulfonatronum lacustre TaxID=66849 RepID=UPI00049218FE|nr:DUF4160 domain-containing protein [Desulfonatronum lacustre]
MPEISRFFGIIIRMFFEDHAPPHIHTEYSGNKAIFDFYGNVIKGDLQSRTATRLVRDWIDLNTQSLEENWNLAQANQRLNAIEPLR